MVHERCTKVKSFLFSGTNITTIIKFTHIMGTSFTNLSLFFHESSFIINILSNPCERRCAPLNTKFYAEVSNIFTYAMFQLVTCKMASSHSIRQGAKTMETEVLNRKSQQAMRTSSSCLAKHFKFILTSLRTAHTALN